MLSIDLELASAQSRTTFNSGLLSVNAGKQHPSPTPSADLISSLYEPTSIINGLIGTSTYWSLCADFVHHSPLSDTLVQQQAQFFRALAQANGGNIPRDAGRRWRSYLEQFVGAESESEPLTSSPTERPGSRSTAEGHNLNMPPVEANSNPHPPSRPFHLAVTRGGRPLTELSSLAPPQPAPRRVLPRFARRQNDQENLEDQEWEQYENDRRERMRRFEERPRGDSGYGADGEDNDEDGTPPPMGRLERLG